MKSKKRNIIDYIIIIGVPIAFLIIWQWLGNNNMISPAIMPTPLKIYTTFKGLILSEKLQLHLWTSVKRVCIGFLFGASAGIIIGILTGIFKKVDEAVTVVFGILRPIPVIGLVPLLILWFGIGELSKVIVIGIGCFWSVLLNTEHGINGTDVKFLEVAQLLEKSKKTVLLKIVMPAAIPAIFTGLRLGVGAAWRSVVAAEMLASVKGIGYMIAYAREMSQPAVMFVGLLSIGFIGILIDVVILRLQKRLIRWE